MARFADNRRMENRIGRVALVAILLCATLLRIYGLDSRSLEADEVFTLGIAAAENSVLDVLSIPLYNTPVAKPALYFLVTHLFLLVQESDFLMRFPSLAFGVMGVAATYAVGAALFGRKEGLLAAFLVCISPLHLRYSQMARFYPLLMTFSLLSLYFSHQATLKGGWARWAGFMVVSVLNIYTHVFALFVLLSENLFFGLIWLRGLLVSRRAKGVSGDLGSGEGSQPWMSAHARSILVPIASSIVIAVAYAPMIPHLLRSLGGPKGIVEEAETPGMELSTSFFRGLTAEWSTGPGIGALVFLSLFVLGLIACLRHQRMQFSLVVLWMAVPFVVLFALPLQHRFYPRYLVALLPVYLIIVARALTAFDNPLKLILERIGREKLGRYRAGLVVGLIVLGSLSVSPLQEYYSEILSDWRSAAVLLGGTVSPGETIIVRRPANQLALVHYDERLADVEFSVLRPRDPVPANLLHQRGVWFVGKEGRKNEMSRLEEELSTPPGRALAKWVFEGRGDHNTPGAGESMFWDVWVLYH